MTAKVGGQGGRGGILNGAPVAVLATLVCLASASAQAAMQSDAPPSGSVDAPARSILLLRADEDDPGAREAATLMIAELRAAAFEPVEVPHDSGRAITADLDAAWSRVAPAAAFVIAPGPDGGATIDLWVEDRVARHRVARRIVAPSGAASASDLALKAVESLHGSLLEVSVPRSEPPALAVAGAPGPAVPLSSAYFLDGLVVSGGAGLLALTGVDPVVAPLLRVGWGSDRGYGVRLAAMGLGTTTSAAAPEGTARLRQTLFTIEGLRAFRPDARVQPALGVAAGAHVLNAQGTGASSLFVSRTVVTVAPALAAQAGLALRLTDRLALSADASLLWVVKETSIVIAAGSTVARVGGLSALVTTNLCLRL